MQKLIWLLGVYCNMHKDTLFRCNAISVTILALSISCREHGVHEASDQRRETHLLKSQRTEEAMAR